ncbi:putative proteasome subunit alpha type-7 [Neolecta irregularis DAH-3]|uniref:Putative proteasome subunit alpha type-7 n=1 Tax=Neolecta irregularis (strain DAH-3) TaxID=1198029 RepID=A0A1U7LVL6_NEOID|nr:putative proteasome subunit alpha type-7 [Neolecta irregularis DAH-3]|eukprot:OLL26669.1 putative proteasome subunit alpha type-7 [Neolecta irregularis DAH-3]
MSGIGSGYDLSCTYSPDGRVFQVEYAGKAVENAGTAIGLRVNDGVVLAVQKLVQSKLLKPGANKRLATVDRHIGIAFAGLIPDGEHLIRRARDEAQNWREQYKAPIPGDVLADRVSQYVQAYTLYSSVRPFGIGTIVAAVDEDGPQLYAIEPSGESWGYFGAAIGKGRRVAKTELEKLDLKNLTVRDAVKEAAKIIYATHDEGKDKDFELEMSWISNTETNGHHQFVPAEIIEEAERLAKDADDMEE